jgi:hypothetical protein
VARGARRPAPPPSGTIIGLLMIMCKNVRYITLQSKSEQTQTFKVGGGRPILARDSNRGICRNNSDIGYIAPQFWPITSSQYRKSVFQQQRQCKFYCNCMLKNTHVHSYRCPVHLFTHIAFLYFINVNHCQTSLNLSKRNKTIFSLEGKKSAI